MRYGTALVVLVLAALLEAGGDAIVRLGLHADMPMRRAAWLAAGGLVLFGYGYMVNAAPWDFGRLLGLYVVFFFVIAQVLAWFLFGQAPTRSILIGGAFIVVGGAIISLGAG